MTHIRILNAKYTRLIDIKEALEEINYAMMEGADEVAEMSASGSSAKICYEDGRVVILRPATSEEIEERAGKEWCHAASNITLWHRFGPDLKALCNRRIRPSKSGHVSVKDPETGKWYPKDKVGHDDLSIPADIPSGVTMCSKCQEK